jgi:hypothetical protein
MSGICRLAKELLASQEGLYSMESVGQPVGPSVSGTDWTDVVGMY